MGVEGWGGVPRVLVVTGVFLFLKRSRSVSFQN